MTRTGSLFARSRTNPVSLFVEVLGPHGEGNDYWTVLKFLVYDSDFGWFGRTGVASDGAGEAVGGRRSLDMRKEPTLELRSWPSQERN